jgi:hypothetical protein
MSARNSTSLSSSFSRSYNNNNCNSVGSNIGSQRTSGRRSDENFNQVVVTTTTGVETGETPSVMHIIQYILMAIGAMTVLQVLSQSLFYLGLLTLPLGWGYFKVTCPPIQTFDAKEQLNPILKKQQNQQQALSSSSSLFEKMFNSIVGDAAATTAVEFTEFWGLAVLAKVTYRQQIYYWIGAGNQWKFVYSWAGSTGCTNHDVPITSTTTTTTHQRTSSSSNNNNNNTTAIRESITESITRRGSSAAAAAAAVAMAALSNSTVSSRPGSSSNNNNSERSG